MADDASTIDALIARSGATPEGFFKPIADLPKTYWEGLDQKAKQEQRDVFKDGIPKDANGDLDLKGAYEKLLKVGGMGASKEGLGGLVTIRNQDIEAGQDRNLYGSGQPVSGQPTPSMPAPTVQPAPRVMGDNEGVRAGVYDPPAAPGQRPPIQNDAPPAPQPGPQAMPQPTPSQVVAQRFPNPAAPVSPAAAPQADPSLGGLIPSNWKGSPGDFAQTLRQYASRAAALGNKDLAKQRQDHADAIDKAIGQYREAGLKERQSVIEPAIKFAIESVGASKTKADAIADGISVSHDLRAQLDAKSGIFSGQWADQKLSLAKIGRAVGLDLAPNQITNTESFSALVGKKVAQTVKSFGSGTSITNQDREYAAKMEAGDIKLDETSMRRILDITDKINRGIIKKHNDQVGSLIRSRPELAHMAENFTVDMPPKYGAGPITHDEYLKLQPGQQYVAPDGSTRTKGR